VVDLWTARLVLRQWREADLDPFAALNADPEVMRYFPAPLTREQSDALASHAQATIAREGWGLWAVETIEDAAFIGLVGLNRPRFEAHFTPAVEVGWRLARSCWGKGYATEAARAAVAFGFDQLRLDEIVSFTAAVNERSWRVMERLGMVCNPAEDFDHPAVPEGPLGKHVLYRLGRRGWEQTSPVACR
jgi:RimJ/RimL family protein N-acetyltransferase